SDAGAGHVASVEPLQSCYKSRVVYFSPVGFFKKHDGYGGWQRSGVSIQMSEGREQSAFCLLSSGFFLTPKIKPRFVNYLRSATLGENLLLRMEM
ncbi:MAG: hypothetical protein PVF26_16345, partial [Desulfobacterales bacterium]